jgi:predicted DNA-binding helix-hairpin-helix protein
VDLNRAPRELLLRVPGLGMQSVERLLAQRPWRRVRVEDLVRLHVPVARALPFIVAADHVPRLLDADALARRRALARTHVQLELFPDAA